VIAVVCKRPSWQRFGWCDHLHHHCHVLTIRDDSYRLRAKRKSDLIKAPAGDGSPAGYASQRSVTANHQSTP
jgi:hypothetical protein